MVRVLVTAAAAVLLMAASPTPKTFFNGPVLLDATISAAGVASAPKQAPTDGAFTAAPMPDQDQAAPVQRTLGPTQPEFAPSLFRTQKTYRGEGFTFGSTAQGNQERRFRPTPGVNLKVPLE